MCNETGHAMRVQIEKTTARYKLTHKETLKEISSATATKRAVGRGICGYSNKEASGKGAFGGVVLCLQAKLTQHLLHSVPA